MSIALWIFLWKEVFKGKLSHNFMISHLVFTFGPLDLVKTEITENNENIHIISVYKENKSDFGTFTFSGFPLSPCVTS